MQKQLSTMELKSNVMKRKLTVYEPKRVNQKIKRKAAIIQQRNMQVKRLQCKIKKLETKLVTGDSRTDRLRRSNAQLQRKLAHHKEKTDQKPRLNQSADLSSLKDKVSFLENATLSEHIQQLDNEKISAKVDGKKYSDALRAIYHCVSKNVALENLESVIKSVVKVMSGKEIVGFPDTSTCRVILREMMVSDRLQGSSYNTLKYDLDKVSRIFTSSVASKSCNLLSWKFDVGDDEIFRRHFYLAREQYESE